MSSVAVLTERLDPALSAVEQRHRFAAGGIDVEVLIRGNSPPGLAALLRLYPPALRPPRLSYRFWQEGDVGAVARGDEVLWRGSDPGEVLAAFELDLYRSAVATLPPDWLCFHAGAVAFADRALLFCAPSGGGKSSMCTAAVMAGGAYLSDELAPVDSDGLIHPFPRPLQWEDGRHPAFDRNTLVAAGRFEAASYRFPDRMTGAPVDSLLLLPTHVATAAQPIGALILPEYVAGLAEAELRAVTRGEGIMALAGQCYGDRTPLELLRSIAARLPPIPVFHLRFGNVHAGWALLVSEVLPSASAEDGRSSA